MAYLFFLLLQNIVLFCRNDYIDVMVTGIPNDFKDSAIVLCVYVKDKGGFYYLNGGVTSETVVGNSYNEIMG